MTGFFSIHAPHPAKNLYGSQSINFYIVKIQIFGSKFWSALLSTGPRPREESGADQKRRCDTSNGETQYHGWCLIWGTCCIHTCSTDTIESIAPLIYLPTIIWVQVTANLLRLRRSVMSPKSSASRKWKIHIEDGVPRSSNLDFQILHSILH